MAFYLCGMRAWCSSLNLTFSETLLILPLDKAYFYLLVKEF